MHPHCAPQQPQGYSGVHLQLLRGLPASSFPGGLSSPSSHPPCRTVYPSPNSLYQQLPRPLAAGPGPGNTHQDHRILSTTVQHSQICSPYWGPDFLRVTQCTLMLLLLAFHSRSSLLGGHSLSLHPVYPKLCFPTPQSMLPSPQRSISVSSQCFHTTTTRPDPATIHLNIPHMRQSGSCTPSMYISTV